MRADFRSDSVDYRPWRVDIGQEGQFSGHKRADPRPEKSDFRSERADFRLERADYS